MAPHTGAGTNPRGMECLIPVINKLQDVFDQTGITSSSIELPQIAVVGSQSSGKSSVLESLVGKPFLPRGSGIVTRCPIVLKLIHTPGTDEWCEFEHKPNVPIRNFNDVEAEILKRTNEIVPSNGVSDEKIKLTVRSPNVLTLTVVDLPGVVNIPVDGQPADIERQTTELVQKYISQPKTVILAVSDGSIDIANSVSIKLAKEVDPTQDRTIGVVTKVDLAPNDLTTLLSGKTVPMKLGMVGVINRSQDDINNDITIDEVLEREEDFFKRKYPALHKTQGSQYLATRLNEILMRHIKKSCPDLDMRVKDLLAKKKAELSELGTGIEMTYTEKFEEMNRILDKFAKTYGGHIDGQQRTVMNPKEPSGGARINYAFNATLPTDLGAMDPLATITDEDIMIAIKNSGTVISRLFHPEAALHHLIRGEVAKMKPVAQHCAKLVHQEMIGIIQMCLDSNHRFLGINDAICEVVTDLLERRSEVATAILDNYIDVQAASAFTASVEYHTEITTSMASLNSVDLGNLPLPLTLKNGTTNEPLVTLSSGEKLQPNGPSGFTPEQDAAAQKVKKLIQTYYDIVRKQVLDHVPKSLLHSLIYHTADELSVALNTKLGIQEKVEELVQEPKDTASKRKALTTEIEGYMKASKLLDDVRGSKHIF